MSICVEKIILIYFRLKFIENLSSLISTNSFFVKMSNLTLHKKKFSELTLNELYELLKIRSEVFVVEQNCIYQDLDGDDKQSIHLWLTEGERVVALCRICPAGIHLPEVSIGRVITTVRGKGYGKILMLHAIETAVECYKANHITLEAQEYAKGFYESVGFKVTSATFLLDGIPHVKMEWRKR